MQLEYGIIPVAQVALEVQELLALVALVVVPWLITKLIISKNLRTTLTKLVSL